LLEELVADPVGLGAEDVYAEDRAAEAHDIASR
jgi:hypothetical protein